MFVGLEVFVLAVYYLETIVFTRFYNKQGVSILTFLNDSLALLSHFFFHSIDQSLLILMINILEKNGVPNETKDQKFRLLGFRNTF